MKNKRIYIKNKFRLMTIILLLSLLNMGTTIVAVKNEVFIKNSYTDYIYITAKSGDTLWKITSNTVDKIDIVGNLDFRDVVGIVADLNGGSQINAGQIIRIPKVIK